MDAPDAFLTHAPGLSVALAIGLLIGRNLVDPAPDPGRRGKPGLRDALLLALLGGASGLLAQPLLTGALLVAAGAVLVAARLGAQAAGAAGPRGMTSEFAVLGAFVLGHLAVAGSAALAAALGIAAAALLARKEDLHRFAATTISNREYGDTLKFLALVFIIYPLLPPGAYGPYGFFDPRKIWFFIILISAVSYCGYFFARFLGGGRARIATALLGGLASTTAYTGAAARIVSETPALAHAMVRPTLLANAVMFPRMAALLLVLDTRLALRCLPLLAAMAAAGLLAAWILGHRGERPCVTQSPDFPNPFSLRPALKFGVLFAFVLFLTKAGQDAWGSGGWRITSVLGGFMDVDAVLLSLGDFFKAGRLGTGEVGLGLVLAAAANAVFKTLLAAASRQPAFFLRLAAGFLLIFTAGALFLWLE